MLAAKADDGDWNAAVSTLLRAALDRGLVPRRLSEGQSLESHFLNITGSGEIVDE